MTQQEFDQSVTEQVRRKIREAEDNLAGRRSPPGSSPGPATIFPDEPCENMEFRDGQPPDGGHTI